jgi:uncharacterized membrane protein
LLQKSAFRCIDGQVCQRTLVQKSAFRCIDGQVHLGIIVANKYLLNVSTVSLFYVMGIVFVSIMVINTPVMTKKEIRTVSRIILGTGLVLAGISHLTFARKGFKAQVPDWVPLKKDDTVLYSGMAEIALGGAVALAGDKRKETMGKVLAAFFIAVFPGNVSQYEHSRNGLTLNTDSKRFIRLLFQPLLVYWALKSTRKTKAEKALE